jgi:hypothetical protein
MDPFEAPAEALRLAVRRIRRILADASIGALGILETSRSDTA